MVIGTPLSVQIRSRETLDILLMPERVRERRRGQFHLFLGRESSSSWSPLSLVEEDEGERNDR